MALRRAGVTVSLAPVGDVPTVTAPRSAGRAFSRDPAAASAAMAAAVTGWRAGGIAATAKHFPGLGGATVNTDDGPATIRRSRAQLEATDLPPFAAAIRAGVPLVMVGHARYPALDAERIASQSPAIVEQLLRDRLGFRGVVVTDSMEARASLATGDDHERLRAGGTRRRRPAPAHRPGLLRAGLPSTCPRSRGRSPPFRARVRESAARVLALKADGARHRAERSAILAAVTRPTPNIGVTCNVEVVQYGGLWTEPAAMVPLTYVRAIARAGGRPLLLAPTPADLADPAELLDLLDGVLVTGGADLDPAAYGEPPHPETAAASAERDAFELLLVRAAAERDLPCLGICRGMQVVNVAYGGALEQHLAARLEHDIHRGDDGEFADHQVEVEPESLAALAAGATHVAVKSYHHQGVARRRRGPAGHRPRRRRRDRRGARGRGPALHARGALAPRGGRGRPPDRRVRGTGARVAVSGGPDRSGPPVELDWLRPAQPVKRGATAPWHSDGTSAAADAPPYRSPRERHPSRDAMATEAITRRLDLDRVHARGSLNRLTSLPSRRTPRARGCDR